MASSLGCRRGEVTFTFPFLSRMRLSSLVFGLMDFCCTFSWVKSEISLFTGSRNIRIMVAFSTYGSGEEQH